MKYPAPPLSDLDAWHEYLKVFTQVSPEGCWEWTRSRDTAGYGCARVEGKTRAIHPISYRIYRGDIPDGMCVLHTCDNRRCCNPEHLFLGSRTDNNRDRDQKGRQIAPVGVRNGNAKLTDETVRMIRALHHKKSQRQLAQMFGVDRSLVGLVVNRKIWKHVT